jgi:hypothetical protein
VRYSVLHENEQMFASRYKLVLPTEAELRAELERERYQLAKHMEPTWRSTWRPQGGALIRPGLHALREGNRSRCQEAARRAFSRYCGR